MSFTCSKASRKKTRRTFCTIKPDKIAIVGPCFLHPRTGSRRPGDADFPDQTILCIPEVHRFRFFLTCFEYLTYYASLLYIGYCRMPERAIKKPSQETCEGFCGEEDLNFHTLSSTSTSSWRVYQFHHRRVLIGKNKIANGQKKVKRAQKNPVRTVPGCMVAVRKILTPLPSTIHEDCRTQTPQAPCRRQ